MLPKVYPVKHPRTPWLVVYTDPTQRDARGKPKRVQRWFKLEGDARDHHRELMRSAASVGTSGLSLDARARADYYAGRQILDAAGHDGVSVTEALRAYVQERPATARLLTPVATLVPLFLAAKEVEEHASKPTVANLKARVTAWINRDAIVTVGDITEGALVALKQRKGVSARTKINDMAAVSSFLSWLKERRLIERNGLLEIGRPKTDAHLPKVLTPAQVRALLMAALELAEGRLVRWLALQLLAGLRPNEAAQVRPEQVRLSAKPAFVRVLRGKKRNRVRPAPVLKNFAAWWNAAPWPQPTTKAEKEGRELVPLHREARDRRLFDNIRERAGLIRFEKGHWTARPKRVESHWQGDICRHTWISVRMQQLRDEVRVAYEGGTSVEMIHGHYLDTIDDRGVQEIESILPPKRTAALTSEAVAATVAA